MSVNYYCSSFSGLEPIENELFETIKKDLTNTNKMIIVVGEPDRQQRMIEKFEAFKNLFKKHGINFKEVILIDKQINKDEAYNHAKSSDLIFLMGGNPFKQKQLLKEKGIYDLLKNFDGVLVGGSAGAMNMSKYIVITPLNEEYPDFVIEEGLNLNNITIVPHYQYEGSIIPSFSGLEEEPQKLADIIKMSEEAGKLYLLQDTPVASAIRVDKDSKKIIGDNIIVVDYGKATIESKI